MVKYQNRRKRSGKYSGMNRLRNYKRGGVQLARDVMYIKSVINSELHIHRVSFTNQTLPSAGGIVALSTIAQGDTNPTRSGQSILPKYLNARFCLNNANAGVEDTVRVIFLMWKANSIPVIASVLENTSPWSHYADKNTGSNSRDRNMLILSDKTYTIINGTEKQCINLKLDMPMNKVGVASPIHIKYDGPTTTSPHNGIYMAYVGTHAVTYSLLNGEVNFKFYDN